MDMNEKIKSRREELGLTLQEVGEYIGVSKATVQRYESGEIKNLKQETISRLSEILKISPAYLMGWEDEQIKHNTFTYKEINLINKYRSLDSKGKHTVNTVLDMEYSRCNNVLLAAHEKEDVNKNSPTYEEDYKHDLDIMMDDNEWK